MRRVIGSIVDLWDKVGCMGQLVLVLALAVVVGLPCGALSLVLLPPTPLPGVTLPQTTSSQPTGTTVPNPPTPAAMSTGTPAAGEVASRTVGSVATPSEAVAAQVVRVLTGGSIDVAIENRLYRVSYLGIQVPDGVGEPFAQEAEARNEKLVGGQTVLLEKDVSDVDSFGQQLRYVYVGDLFVNAELVRLGFARANSSAPDVKHQDLLLRLEGEARQAGRGLWAAGQTAGTAAVLPTGTVTELPQTTATTTAVATFTATVTPQPTVTATPTPSPSSTPTGTPTPTATATLRPLPTATAEPTSPLPTASASPGCPAKDYFPAKLCSGCAEYIGSRRTKVFYYPWCRNAQKISPDDLECFYSREEAIAAGYTADEECGS
jgi:micrococcal nuclease